MASLLKVIRNPSLNVNRLISTQGSSRKFVRIPETSKVFIYSVLRFFFLNQLFVLKYLRSYTVNLNFLKQKELKGLPSIQPLPPSTPANYLRYQRSSSINLSQNVQQKQQPSFRKTMIRFLFSGIGFKIGTYGMAFITCLMFGSKVENYRLYKIEDREKKRREWIKLHELPFDVDLEKTKEEKRKDN